MFKKIRYIALVLVFLAGMIGVVPEVAQAGGSDVMEYAVPADVLAAQQAMPRPDYKTVDALPLPKVPRNAVLSGGAADYSGKSGRGYGSAPDPAAKELMAEYLPQLDQGFDLQGAMEPYVKAMKYTDYPLNSYAYTKYAYYPYITIGRLWIIDGGSYVGWCTASVISSSILVTAAHCVFDTYYNSWYDGWEFDPYAQAGSSLGGIWFSATNATIPTKYALAGDWWKGRAYDVALVSLGTYSGHTVNYYTGTLGWAYGWGPVQLQHTFGYPANMPDGGAGIWSCIGQSSASGKNWMKMGCPMEGGSSGGPWIIWFDGMDNFYMSSMVNGTVSGGVAGSNINNGANFVWDNFGILCYAWGFC